MRIAVIGAGLIGQAWAIVFARGGCEVCLWDADPAAQTQAVKLIEQLAVTLQTRGLIADASAIVSRIATADSLEDALANVDYVQENLPEKIGIKKEIFSRMDALAGPDVVLASSTSSIPASAFTEALPGRGRCLVAHPVNPPYLIPVVELCGAPWTHAEIIDRAAQIMTEVGQKPVRVNAEVQGFVLNRLQGALLREAFKLVQSGCVSVEDLDVTVKDGLGLRWSFMGPFETIDLNAPEGVRDYCARYGDMYTSIAQQQTSTDAWSEETIAAIEAQRRALLPDDSLLDRRVWRDERLMALMQHKKQMDDPGCA